MDKFENIINHKDTKAQRNTKHEPLSPKEENIGRIRTELTD